MTVHNELTKRWGIVLAGGDGLRLKPLTQYICGDDRPKQFCPLYDGFTLLKQTRERAERSIRPDQIFYSLAQQHQTYYLRDLGDCPSQRVVQPLNKGTTPAILYTLLLIAQSEPNASVAILPSDHHYSDEAVFSDSLDSAFDLARREPRSVVLLGARALSPETEYGWIEPAAAVPGAVEGFFHVRRFFEKPPADLAKTLLDRRALWNTFVMVGSIRAFLEMVWSTVPDLLGALREMLVTRKKAQEIRLSESSYAQIRHSDFSQQVLSIETSRLIVRRLGPVVWSDLGSCDRAVEALSANGVAPAWVKNWQARPHTEDLMGMAAAV